MNLVLYILLLVILGTILNYTLKKKGVLISYTGDAHQKFASTKKIPLTGGIILFFGLIYFCKSDNLIFFFFLMLILILGIFSDLKILSSALLRFIFQITTVLLFVVFDDLKIFDTRIVLLNEILNNFFFNYIFVTFCILIVINGSNFIDGLNTLNIGYFISIFLILIFLNNDGQIFYSNNFSDYYLIYLVLIFVLNFLNKLYLGDSGSYLLGFMFSVVLIEIYNLNSHLSPFFIILLLWYPCYEILFSIIRKNIIKKSPMEPDTKHLHQLIFVFLIKNFKLQKMYSNFMTSTIINLYNLLIFLIALKITSNTQGQILLIILNIFVYSYTYYKIYPYKN